MTYDSYEYIWGITYDVTLACCKYCNYHWSNRTYVSLISVTIMLIFSVKICSHFVLYFICTVLDLRHTTVHCKLCLYLLLFLKPHFLGCELWLGLTARLLSYTLNVPRRQVKEFHEVSFIVTLSSTYGSTSSNSLLTMS